MKRLMLCVVLACSLGCAGNAPPNLTPQARVAWSATQVIKALDVVRDIATDANATMPPLLSTADTRKVVVWHEAAITIAHGATAGWPGRIQTSLDALLTALPANETTVLKPYISLLETVLKEATS